MSGKKKPNEKGSADADGLRVVPFRGNIYLFGSPIEDAVDRFIENVPAQCARKREKRDASDKHHVTVVHNSEISSNRVDVAQFDVSDFRIVGYAVIHSSVHVLVCVWPSAQKWRESHRLPQRDFHVTLGFRDTDDHEARKDIRTIRNPNAIDECLNIDVVQMLRVEDLLHLRDLADGAEKHIKLAIAINRELLHRCGILRIFSEPAHENNLPQPSRPSASSSSSSSSAAASSSALASSLRRKGKHLNWAHIEVNASNLLALDEHDALGNLALGLSFLLLDKPSTETESRQHMRKLLESAAQSSEAEPRRIAQLILDSI